MPHEILRVGMMSQGDRGRTSALGNTSWLLPGPPRGCRDRLGATSQLKGRLVPYQQHHITPGLCSSPAQPHPTALQRLQPRQSLAQSWAGLWGHRECCRAWMWLLEES